MASRRALPHRPLVPGALLSGKLKVVGFVSNLEGGGPWSQVSCVPNLVQIVQEMKKFWGLRHSPGRHSAAVGRQGASDGWPASERAPPHRPLVPGVGKCCREKILSFQSPQTKFGVPIGCECRRPPTDFEKNRTILNGIWRFRARMART